MVIARRFAAPWIVASGLVACLGGGSPTGQRNDGTNVDVAKVDPSVVAAMSRGDSLSVIVLGQTQLLERVGGLEQFQIAHDGSTRQTLRTEVIARLRGAAS